MHQPGWAAIVSDLLRLKDVRDAFHLIGECRELGADPSLWREHLLDGLRRLTGAQLALYLQIRGLGTEAETLAEPQDVGFLDAAHRELWVHYQRENAQRDDPFHLRYYAGFHGALRTRRLESVVEMREWQRSRHYNEYVRACALEDRITSSAQLPAPHSAATQVIVLHRSASDGPYSERAVRLVHLVHEELLLLTGKQLAPNPPPREENVLPFQLQQVLACVLEGDSEKHIAVRLGISRHTVNRHMQRLYRRFDVHSRTELMARCRDMRTAPSA
jgi:DNA-binding CsgD family transcriptional regulator